MTVTVPVCLGCEGLRWGVEGAKMRWKDPLGLLH